MGCGNTHIRVGGELIKQENIELNINEQYKNKELTQAQTLIHLITTIRNKIIYEYDNLIYITGACLFKNPTMAHCTKCVLFKICSECQGDLNNANIKFKEDPPYMTINSNNFSASTNNLIAKLFEFVINLRDYKLILKQLDKETPKLMYIVFDNSNRISKDNLGKINKAITLFKDLTKLRSNILVEYKNQIYDLINDSNRYKEQINKIGALAYKEKISDIYEITMLFKNNMNEFIDYFIEEEWIMHNNIKEAKRIMEKKLEKEKIEDTKEPFLTYSFRRELSYEDLKESNNP